MPSIALPYLRTPHPCSCTTFLPHVLVQPKHEVQHFLILCTSHGGFDHDHLALFGIHSLHYHLQFVSFPCFSSHFFGLSTVSAPFVSLSSRLAYWHGVLDISLFWPVSMEFLVLGWIKIIFILSFLLWCGSHHHFLSLLFCWQKSKIVSTQSFPVHNQLATQLTDCLALSKDSMQFSMFHSAAFAPTLLLFVLLLSVVACCPTVVAPRFLSTVD
jgi:hypothetical protein